MIVRAASRQVDKQRRVTWIRESVSIIEAVSADGYFLPPLVIYRGRNIWEDTIEADGPAHRASIATLNGYTSNEVLFQWLTTVFEPHTKRRQRGNYRLLLLDSYKSHLLARFIRFCCLNQILLLVLPAHTSHLLQPLDVAIFGPLGHFYNAEIDKISKAGGKVIDKIQFLQCLKIARRQACTLHNVQSAWAKAGLEPFNPQRVLSELRPITPKE